ncbi:hypothetical protein [Pseudomarimonas salicorniae]|uniref:Type IV pili methyl-accepting chemotaxis transducer N-term n=1 Tax=Pseudomarimonas salicorniae TaxID=2933270 RepID=A0ABT0GES2_9GAMM|nr:hypothetical protein [Lysobacter sp. CAU 1642]MCK7592933.1 hypothetical protein [Lysobacter sp. CAU 1642]
MNRLFQHLSPALLLALTLAAGNAARAASGPDPDCDPLRAAVLVNALRAETAALPMAGRLAAEAKHGEAFDALRSDAGSVERLAEAVREFARQGCPGLPSKELLRLADESPDLLDDVAQLERAQQSVLDAAEAADTLAAQVPALQAATDQASRALVESGAEAAQVYLATRMLSILERLRSGSSRVIKGGVGAVSAADTLGRDVAMLRQTAEGFVDGSAALGIKAVENATARSQFEALRSRLTTTQQVVDTLLRQSSGLFEVQDAADSLWLSAPAFDSAAVDVLRLLDAALAARAASAAEQAAACPGP